MNRKKNQKVFKHVLCNPFVSVWPEITNEETQQMVNVLNREAISQALSAIKIENKKLKTNEANLESFLASSLILGINEIITNLSRVSFVVMLKCEMNEVILEPLMLLCRNKSVKSVCGNFEVVYEKFREITGVHKLAAFALPTENCFPILESFLNSLCPKPSKKLAGLQIKSFEIEKKVSKKK